MGSIVNHPDLVAFFDHAQSCNREPVLVDCACLGLGKFDYPAHGRFFAEQCPDLVDVRGHRLVVLGGVSPWADIVRETPLAIFFEDGRCAGELLVHSQRHTFAQVLDKAPVRVPTCS